MLGVARVSLSANNSNFTRVVIFFLRDGVISASIVIPTVSCSLTSAYKENERKGLCNLRLHSRKTGM